MNEQDIAINTEPKLVPTDAEAGAFIESFHNLATTAYQNSAHKGFWKDGKARNKGEMIALMHSELSECLEGARHGDPESDKIHGFSVSEEELADTIIRIMDYAYGFELRVAQALIAKMHYNAGRAPMHGGKAF